MKIESFVLSPFHHKRMSNTAESLYPVELVNILGFIGLMAVEKQVLTLEKEILSLERQMTDLKEALS